MYETKGMNYHDLINSFYPAIFLMNIVGLFFNYAKLPL